MKMATAQTTQPTNFKLDGTGFSVSPVPEDKRHSSVKAGHAVYVYIPGLFGSGRSCELYVELEANSSDSGYKVFILDPNTIVSGREYVFTYDHNRRAIFDHDPTPFIAEVEQMIGAALYYVFIYSSSSAETPKPRQWFKEWHGIIQKNVRAQMAQFNPVRG